MEETSGFQPSCEVVDPKFLFGHNQKNGLLQKTITQLQLGTNIQILGERRTGKTSILKCCKEMLKANTNNFIPIYLNFREHHLIKGYANTHRLLLAYIHMATLPYGFELSPLLDKKIFTNKKNIELQYELLSKVSDYQIDSLISQYINDISSKKMGVILLFDEYEHLIRYSYEEKEGAFFFLRDISSMPSNNSSSPKPLTYVIAGALPWNQLCKMIGSPELNNVGAVFYIDPLDAESFSQMWDSCLSASSPSMRNNVIETKLDINKIFNLAGGWPFYGKVIGELLSTDIQDEAIIYESLFQHFNTIWTRLSDDERKALHDCITSKVTKNNSTVRNLIYRGLLEENNELVIPKGDLWSKFIQENLEQTQNLETFYQNTNETKFNLLVNDIGELITDINEASLNLLGRETFRCSNQDIPTYKDLRTPANTSEQFSQFALSLYNLFFERTTGPKKVKVVGNNGKTIVEQEQFRALELLPADFRRQRTMIRIIDATRHHYGKGHLTRLDTFNSKGGGIGIEKILERYLGSKVPPRDAQFLELQAKILEDVIEFLRELLNHISNYP